jgi:hypothetical protein
LLAISACEFPTRAFCDDPAERAWLSRRIPDAVHWSALATEIVANPREAGAVVALDTIVFNEARHGGNLLATGYGRDSEVTVWAIDADEALVGHVLAFASLGDAVPDPRIHALGFPAAALRAEALVAADTASKLSPSLLRAMVEASCALAREPRVDELAAALLWRCAAAPKLTADYLVALEARR